MIKDYGIITETTPRICDFIEAVVKGWYVFLETCTNYHMCKCLVSTRYT